MTLSELSIPIVRYITIILTLATLSGCITNFVGNKPVPTRMQASEFNPELAYLEKIMSSASDLDINIVALLLQEYQNSNNRHRGIAFFTNFLDEHEFEARPDVRIVSLSSLGILRAEIANDVPLLGRNSWVNETIQLLENARDLSGNSGFFPRFAAAIVYSKLPARFGKTDQAAEDIRWLVENEALSPFPGLMRPVFAQARQLGIAVSAQSSALPESGRNLTTNFSVSSTDGATLFPPTIDEIEPGRVYRVSGVEFTEYYFIRSQDNQQLISIDAGTRPDLASRAYKRLQAYINDLPPLTTVFITHAHWDHIGGLDYFRQLHPELKVYGRANYKDAIALMDAGPQTMDTWFFGESFDSNSLMNYKPDVPVSGPTSVTIGGSKFDLIPAPASETPDALFIKLNSPDVLFVGDTIMPFIGAPFIEEGSPDGFIAAARLVEALNPQVILHGHRPLTDFFDNVDAFANFHPHISWLINEVRAQIKEGRTAVQIHNDNLIPDSLYADGASQQFYLVTREHIINRLYDQSVGYWQTDYEGLRSLGANDYGTFLSRYLTVDEDEIASALAKMIKAGDYHMTERVVRWARTQWPESQRLIALQRLVALQLRAKYQAYNPFKFILYSELANAPVEPVSE